MESLEAEAEEEKDKGDDEAEDDDCREHPSDTAKRKPLQPGTSSGENNTGRTPLCLFRDNNDGGGRKKKNNNNIYNALETGGDKAPSSTSFSSSCSVPTSLGTATASVGRGEDLSSLRTPLLIQEQQQLRNIHNSSGNSAVSPSVVHKVQFAAERGKGCNSAPSNKDHEVFESDHDEGDENSCSAQAASTAVMRRQQQQRGSVSRKRTVSDASYFSAASLPRSEGSSSTSTSYSFTAPDGGWGWVVVMASFLVNMIADGVTFSFGVIFVELQKEFSESKAATAGVVSLFHAVPLLSGPIASALTDKYGCRKMTILGSLLATFGFLISTLCNRLEMLYITFGIISGFGLSLCYVAAIVIVAYYFDRRRSFATGISVCGSGVGTFLFAPITQFLIDEFGGWRGATVILAGVFLNMCVCGMLFKDLEWTRKRRRLKRQESNNNPSKSGSVGTMSNKSGSAGNNSMPELTEIKDLLENGDVRALFSKEELKDYCPRLSSSLVNIPTYISNGERLPEEVILALSKNQTAYKLVVDNYPEALQFILSGDPNNASDNEEENKSNPNLLAAPEASEPTGVKLKRKVSSLFRKRPNSPMTPNRSILKKPPTSPSLEVPSGDAAEVQTVLNLLDNEVFTESQQQSNIVIQPKRTAVKNLHHLRVRRQSLTYRGAMLNINRYRLRASSCPDIYRNSMTTIAQGADIENRSVLVSVLLGAKDFFSECCACNFFNPRFVIFCLSNFVLYAWYDVMYVYLMDYAEKDLMFTDATYLISIIGILNTIGEVLIGWMGDQPWMNLNLLYALCMLGCGISTAVVPFLNVYGHLGAMAGIYGLCISANYSLTSPILVELVSLEQFSHAYGLLLLVQGISNLVGPPFAGYLYDVSRQWYLTFGLAGFFITVSGLLLLILPCFRRARKGIRRRHCSSQASDAGMGGSLKADDDNDVEKVETVITVDNSRRSEPIDIPRPYRQVSAEV